MPIQTADLVNQILLSKETMGLCTEPIVLYFNNNVSRYATPAERLEVLEYIHLLEERTKQQ